MIPHEISVLAAALETFFPGLQPETALRRAFQIATRLDRDGVVLADKPAANSSKEG